ncbi:MAG: Trx7/PDZ domain-containing (seleno)protein [Pirellulales bacterium]
MIRQFFAISLALVLAGVTAQAQDRPTKVRQDREQLKNSEVWIYNDLEEGFKEARRTGKPLFVTLRCIPCEACSRFDKKLLDRQNEVRDLLDKFVCVRVVQGNGLDLSLFQFDYDQSFHAFFLNADKTVYGRFGTRSAREEEEDMTMLGLRQAMLGALELHAGYPANRERLIGKQGRPVEHRVPEELPTLKGKYTDKLNYEGAVVASCIHCHQIRDSERQVYRERNETFPEQVLFPYPLPDVLGLRMNPDERATIAKVEGDSIAASAGLKPGDRIESLDGQPLLSTADLQWVLQHAGSEARLSADIRRGDEKRSVTIDLPRGWRRESDISFRATTWDLRRMGSGGLLLADLGDEERKERQLPTDALALFVKHVGEYGAHATAKRAGFQKGDVIVAVDGQREHWTESQFLAHTLALRPGTRINATVLRDGREIELKLPMQK